MTQANVTSSQPRGYALILVLGISMILAIGVGTMLSYLAAAEKTSGRQRQNREAYYVCDGIGRVISRATVDVLGDATKLESDDSACALDSDCPAHHACIAAICTVDLDAVLRDEIETHMGHDLEDVLNPIGYRLENGSESFGYRDVDADETMGTVGLGRFTGLTGQRRTFTYDLALKKDGGASCKTSATVDTMRVPFGELAVFSDDNLRICPSWSTTDVTRTARYHINGDLKVGIYTLPRTTLTGDLTLCGGATKVKFCAGELCISSGAKKKDLRNTGSLTTAYFSDRARGTSALTLSVIGRRAQAGVRIDDNSHDEDTTNANNFRFLVDPGLNGDTDSVKAMKLAHAAHIRIIDGVWYINNGTWPGKTVWSDHPESYQIPADTDEVAIVGTAREVGQPNLFGGAHPTRYSAVDGNGDVDQGVISYGQLDHVSDRAANAPAVWTPSAGADPSEHVRARAAAHRGFLDIHDRRDATDRGLTNSGNVLPVNFDLAAFIAALADANDNELGAELALAGHDGERQLIVWIGSTWPGSLAGLIGAAERPTRAPSITSAADGDGPLPYPMCESDNVDGDARFCGASGNQRRPNAVRVFNAGAALQGSMQITIASSLPLYVLGSVDREPTGRASPVLPTTHFTTAGDNTYIMDDGPGVFFAADSVTLLSDLWEDATDNPWVLDGGAPTNASAVSRSGAGAVPAYNASFLMGRTVNGPPDYSTPPDAKAPYGLERSLRFLERWGIGEGAKTKAIDSPVVTGSLLIGFRSVYTVAPVCYVNDGTDTRCTADSPWRHFWSSSLGSASRQPPGMPAFSLRAQGETLPDSFDVDSFAAFLAAFFAALFAGFHFP